MRFIPIITCVLIGLGLTVANTYAQQDIILSPLKQFKSGIIIHDIKCKEGYVLIINESDGNPSCVQSDHSTRLLNHGWITLEKFETIHPVIQQKIELSISKNISAKNSVTSSEINTTSYSQIIKNSTNSTVPVNAISNSSIPQSSYEWTKPLPAIQVKPIISSNKPNSIKILSIGMSPNPLKVGDKLQFTLTYQNISDKPVYLHYGIGETTLNLEISPRDNVVLAFPSNHALSISRYVPLYPGQVFTAEALPDYTFGLYQITKPGTLDVTLTLILQKDSPNHYDFSETIQFNVNATK